MTRRDLALVVVLASACGGGATPAPEPPRPEPHPPGPHDGACYWAGRLTATVAPMHGDATCFQSRPLEVELKHEEWSHRGGGDTHLGLVIEAPPASVGVGADGVQVTVNGTLVDCPATIGLAYTFPDGNRSLFANVSVTQDAGTHRVTGRGTATMFCADDRCRCEAAVMLDGAIAF